MQVGSLVEYIGGQDPEGQSWFKLEKNVPYVVTDICQRKFNGVWKPAIFLDATTKYSFRMDMFRELAPPETIELEKLLSNAEYV